MIYNIRCKYYSQDNEYVDIGCIDLPDKPKTGDVIVLEGHNTPCRMFVVMETVKQYYINADTKEYESMLNNDVYVHEIKMAP